MSEKNNKSEKQTKGEKRFGRRQSMFSWLRSRLLTGIVVTAPLGITCFLVWNFIEFVDQTIKPLIPPRWNPETYVDVALPGLGLVVALMALIMIGVLAANFLGQFFLNLGEWLIGRVPFVRSIHMTLKQVLNVFASGQTKSFREVVMVEYPRKDSWAIGFITSEVRGELAEKAPGLVGVFVPTTPNPTSGFLIYVKRDEVRRLDMSVEEGAKLIISAGLVVPEHEEKEETSDTTKSMSKVARLLPSFERRTGS